MTKKVLAIVLVVFIIWINHIYSQPPVNPWTPPEYFPAKAVLIEWDFNNNIWPLYSKLIDECQEVVEVILVVNNLNEENIMLAKLINDGISLSNISFVHVPCERMWIRDHGPISIMTDNGMAFIDLDDLANSGLDENLPTNLANAWGLDSYQLPYIMCGGNFMVNSYNTLFTTERVYTSNTNYPQTQIRADFLSYMGIDSIVTISSMHNDYWGHIDMQIKLLDDSTFVIASVDPGSSPNYDTLENNFTYLSSLTTPYGTPYRIRRLPMANNWKTYANSIMLNNKLILPIYNHPRDSIAIQVYQELLPQHDIVGINCNPIISWEGAIHCITMQLFDDNLITNIKDLSVKDKAFSIYPNPISINRMLNIFSADVNGKALKAEIYNMQGQLVESINLSAYKQHFSFKWAHKAGVYTISMFYENGKSFSRNIVGE